MRNRNIHYKFVFYDWVEECCSLLGWDVSEGERLMPAIDPCWYFCFEDGMTPQEAVREATRKGIVQSQTTRYLARILKKLGKKTVAIRHPMPLWPNRKDGNETN